MPYNDPEKQKTKVREHYQANKESYRERERLRTKTIREWFDNYRTGLSCSQCGEDRPVCLDFHHTSPSNKKYSITRMVDSKFSPTKIMEEMKKCIVLCANCHRVVHNGNRWDKDSREGV